MAKDAMRGRTLRHLWAEFSETLHEQISRDSQGEIIATRWRSTAPAEAFFSTHVLIDTPLRTEFFKHLPGVFTGLGIIGTFLGLIQGLSSFEVTEDPTIARNSLEALLHGVHDAFYVSATAIIVAMIVTLIEKMTISGLARRVELLCQEVDALFAAGAGEEYLAQLVRASETSATQILQLKDSLVGDLKQILFDITDRQVSAINQSAKDIAGDVTRSISESLKTPLDQIARAVDRTTDDRGEAVTQVLTDVLANFSAKLQDMFGSQMGGMTRLLQETTVALQSTIGKFDELAGNIGAAGQGAAQAMAKRIVVEGFADQRGTYLLNLNLSLQRAERVLCALLDKPGDDERPMSDDELEQVRELFLVGGYSSNSARSTLDESRRIELRLEFLAVNEFRPQTDSIPRGSFGVCGI